MVIKSYYGTLLSGTSACPHVGGSARRLLATSGIPRRVPTPLRPSLDKSDGVLLAKGTYPMSHGMGLPLSSAANKRVSFADHHGSGESHNKVVCEPLCLGTLIVATLALHRANWPWKSVLLSNPIIRGIRSTRYRSHTEPHRSRHTVGHG